MFCKKCGSEINEGASFCPKCGTALKSTSKIVHEQKDQSMPPVMPMFKVNTGGKAQGTSSASDSKLARTVKAAAEGIEHVIEKGKEIWEKIGGSGFAEKTGGIKKRSFIAGIAVAAALLLLVVNAARINNFVHRTFSSPEEYYQFVEKKTVNELSGHAGEWYAGYVLDPLNFYDKSVEAELTVELGKDGQEFLGLLGLAGVDVSWMESMSIETGTSIKEGTSTAGLSFALNGSDILSGNMAMDMEEGVVYFRIPELNKTYLGVDMSYLCVDMLEEEGNYNRIDFLMEEFQKYNKKLLQACPDQGEVSKLTKRYMMLALECVNDVSKGKEILKVEGIEQKCTVLKVTIDSHTLQDMYKVVLEEMREDKEVKLLMENMLQAGSDVVDEEVDVDEVYEEFQNTIDDILDNLEYLFYGNEEMIMKVYVDGKGEIKGRSIDFGYISVSSLMPEKGNKFGYELSGNMNGITVKLTGSGKITSGKISGDFQVKYNGASLISVTTKKLDIEDLKSGRMNGGIEVKAASKIGNIIGSVPGLSIIEEMQINMDFKSSKNMSSCKTTLIYDEQNVGSVALSIKTGNGSKAAIPSSKNTIMIEDVDDFEEWFEDIELDGLIKSLKKTDIPSEITDVLENIENIEDIDDIYDALYELERMYYYF